MGSLDSLKTKADFDLVYRHGFYRYGKNFVLYALCQDSKSIGRNLPQILLGLSVSRKVGNAPARNLLKRRVRMICRESIAHTLFSGFSAAWSSRHSGVAPKLQLVFVAKAGIAAMSFSELRESFERTFAFILRNLHSHQGTRSVQPRASSQAQAKRTQPRLRHGGRSDEGEHMEVNQLNRLKSMDSVAPTRLANPKSVARGADVADLARRGSHACV